MKRVLITSIFLVLSLFLLVFSVAYLLGAGSLTDIFESTSLSFLGSWMGRYPVACSVLFLLLSAVFFYLVFAFLTGRGFWMPRPPSEQRGDLLLKKGRTLDALEMFQSLGLWHRVAEVNFELGDTASAEQAMRNVGDRQVSAIASHYAKSGRAEMAALLFGRAGRNALSTGDYTRAADFFQQSGDDPAAMDALERAYKNARSASASKAPHLIPQEIRKRFLSLAEKAGDFRRAARFCESSGDSEAAAAFFVRAGDAIKAARNWVDEGKTQAALHLLGQIPPSHPDFAEVSLLRADIHFKAEKYIDAHKIYSDFFKGTPLSESRVDECYRLGVCQERLGRLADARRTFAAIHALRPYYMNADLRIDAIDQKSEETKQFDTILDMDATRKALEADESFPAAIGARYSGMEELGRGGAGIVYKAKDCLLDRTVALKLLPESLADDQTRLTAFFNEAKVVAKLNHPNIVSIYDIIKAGNRYYIVMEYVDGMSVDRIIEGKGALSMRLALHIANHVLLALEYAHQQDVVHQDIKPPNIIFRSDKKVKLMDFGIASLRGELPVMSDQIVVGTPRYISPEQLGGAHEDRRSDIYSFGITLFEMITGNLPYPEEGILHHHLATMPTSPRAYVRDIPSVVEQIVLKCLIKNPEERYQSASEVLADLRAFFEKLDEKGGQKDDFV